MRIDRAASLVLFHPLARLRALGKNSCTSILMYHSISSETEEERRPYWQVTTTPTQFRQQMTFLREMRCEVVSLRDALQFGTSNDRPRVVITFDDGFLDFLTDAFPVLSDMRFSATVFLPTDFIGNKPLEFKGRRCLTWSEVRELQAAGVDFGSHTVSHPQLHDVSPDRLTHELRVSKEEIEQRIGSSVGSFSYPYAFPEHDAPFCRRLREALQGFGYTTGVTTIVGRAGAGEDPLRLPRLPVNQLDDERLLRAKLEGGYDWVHGLQLATKIVRGRGR